MKSDDTIYSLLELDCVRREGKATPEDKILPPIEFFASVISSYCFPSTSGSGTTGIGRA